MEHFDQGGLGIIGFADDADDLIDIQQDGFASFQNMDPVIDSAESPVRTVSDGHEPEFDPFCQDIRQALLPWSAVDTDHD